MTAGCSPQVQPFHAAAKQVPEIDDASFRTEDDVQLFSRRWLPRGKPKAVIIAVHGMNDYSHSFEGSGAFFAQHGMAVYAYDQRGFGRSPDIGFWAGEDNLKRDLRDYVATLEKRYPHVPTYILAESMGAAVAIAALSEPGFPHVNGVILSAPAVWGAETIPAFYRGTLWLAAHTVPFKKLYGTELKIIASNNIPMLRALSEDPLIIKGTRVDAVYGMVHLMDSAYLKVPALKTPALLLYGGHDQVIPPYPVQSAIVRFTVPVEYAYYPYGYHMLLRDLQATTVMKDILSWMQHPRQPLPSGFGKVRKPGQRLSEKWPTPLRGELVLPRGYVIPVAGGKH
jgi:alpha-beta hydrolase superfamily lysophospholipase